MREIRWVPGAVAPNTNITIPNVAPDIEVVRAAEITRLIDSLTIVHAASITAIAHADGAVVTHANFAVAAHAVHTHDFVSQGQAGAVAIVIGFTFPPIPPITIEDEGAVATHTLPAAAATGIDDATIAGHAITQPDDHPAADIAAGLAAHAVAVALIDHATSGVTVAVPATPTRMTTRIIQVNVACDVGDMLTLRYLEVGEVLLSS